MTKQMKETAGFLALEIKKTVARWLFLLFVGTLAYVFTPVWDTAKAIWNSPASLAQIEQQLADIQDRQLVQIERSIATAMGEDRVIRMVPGLSYVEEPYVLGQDEPLVFHLTVQRTRLGAQCRFQRGASLFTDENGVTFAGSDIRPRRNVGNTPERLVLEIIPPARMISGRTVLVLDLQYDCNGDIVNDRTDPVVFYAVEPE
jgi:hypothetical protein